MKNLITKIILSSALVACLNAGDKFDNLSKEYLDSEATLKVRKVIANDSKTSKQVLKVLVNDSNKEVRSLAKKNLG